MKLAFKPFKQAAKLQTTCKLSINLKSIACNKHAYDYAALIAPTALKTDERFQAGFFAERSRITLVHAVRAVFAQQQHIVGVFSAAVRFTVHSRRANGHCGHGDADGVGAFGKQAFDF